MSFDSISFVLILAEEGVGESKDSRFKTVIFFTILCMEEETLVKYFYLSSGDLRFQCYANLETVILWKYFCFNLVYRT